MSTISRISGLVGSSQHRAFADDALKDEDNAAWVMDLDPDERDLWIQRIGWIRLADRLAESDVVDSSGSEFQKFQAGWHLLNVTGQVPSRNPYQSVLVNIQDAWFNNFPCGASAPAITAWENYLNALATYHQPTLVLDTLLDYEAMLTNLAGQFFQILPFFPEQYRHAAAALGVVDQFYNNLRDLYEDAQQGVCYFPTELLNRFGIEREEILQASCFAKPGYYEMMRFWLNEYLPKLRRQTCRLLLAQDLHPSWEIMRDWSLRRYGRIERIFRQCNFNYVLFPQRYWLEVKYELTAPEIEATQPNLAELGHLYQHAKLSVFLGFSPATLRVIRRLTEACPQLLTDRLLTDRSVLAQHQHLLS